MELYRKDTITSKDIQVIESKSLGKIRQAIDGGVVAFYTKPGLPLCYLGGNMLALLGYRSYEEFVERTQKQIADIFLPSDYRLFKATLRNHSEEKDAFSLEHRLVKQDGNIIWVKSYIESFFDKDGQIVVVLVCMLIQDKKVYEEQSVELSLYKEGSKGGTFRALLDQDFTILSANDLFYKICGYTRQEFDIELENKAKKIICSEDFATIMRKIDKAILRNKAELTWEMRIIKRSGEICWIFISGRLLEEKGYFLLEGFAMDCTERKQAEIAIRLSEERYRIALDRTNTYVWDYDFIQRCIIQTKRSMEINGLPEVIENVPQSLIEIDHVHPDSVKAFLDLYKRLHEGESYVNAIYRTKDSNGEYWWEKVSYTVIFDEEGNPLRAIGVSEDVSIREESENRYRRELAYRDVITPNLYVSYRVNLSKGSVKPYKINIKKNNEIVFVHTYEQLIGAEIRRIPDRVEQEKCYAILSHHELIRAFKEGKEAVFAEYHRKDSQNYVVWVRVSAKLTTEPNTGDCIAFIYIHNIDEYKRAELEQKNLIQRYENEIRMSYDAVFEIDYKRETVHSLAFESGSIKKIQIGDGSFAVAKKTWFDHCRPGAARDECVRISNEETLTEIFKSGCHEISYTLERLDNKTNEYLWYTYWLRKVEWEEHGEKIAMLYMKNVDLERRRQEEHNKVLNVALDSAERANKAKSEFLSRMSHDIRTPMNAIMGMATIAKECLHSPEKVAECLNKIDLSAKYLLSLLNDVLDVAKIESGKMVIHKKEFSLKKFLDDLHNLCKDKATEKNIDFKIDIAPEINHKLEGDVLHLNQILINLLSNAFQYTNIGGKVELEIRQLERTTISTILQFTVRDDGIGIKPEFMEKIFLPFEQDTERTDPKRMGTGLGLSIVHSLVNLMDGVITVDSKVGLGSNFTVKIPFGLAKRRYLMSLEEEDDMLPIIKRKYFFNNERILLVEDNDINQEIIEVFLEEVNLNTEIAVNGKEAVDKFAGSPIGYYSLILMDIRMPIMDGREATKFIRKMDRADACRIPIVALSADAFSEDVRYSERIGMNDYIVKPVNKDFLFSVLDKYLVK